MTRTNALFSLRTHLLVATPLAILTFVLILNSLPGGSSFAHAASAQLFSIDTNTGGTSLPASCDVTQLLAHNKELLNEIAQVNNDEQAQLKEINAKEAKLQPGDDAGNASLQSQQQQVLDSTKAKLADLKAQQEVIHRATQGPSEQCKRDTVANSIAEMRRVQAAVSGSAVSGSLAQVDAEVAKIESLEPTLQANGVNAKDMATIKTSVAAVKTDTATLRSFLGTMNTKASSFIAQASADPIGTYNAMQSGGGPLGGTSGGARSAMNSLVSSFTNLVKLFDNLSGTAGE